MDETSTFEPLSVEEIDQLRTLHKDGDQSISSNLEAVLGADAATMALEGPTDELLELLKDNPDETIESFDSVFGVGASDFYGKPPVAPEAPEITPEQAQESIDQVDEKIVNTTGAVVTGVAGYVAETSEVVANMANDAQELLLPGTDDNSRQITRLKEQLERQERFGKNPKNAERIRAQIEKLEGSPDRNGEIDWDRTDIISEETIGDPTHIGGNIVQGVSQFVAGMVLPGGALGKLNVIAQGGVKAKAAATIIASAVSDFSAFDSETSTGLVALADLLDSPPNVVIDWLRKEDTDGYYEKRIKNLADGAIIGMPLELLLVLGRSVKGVNSGTLTPKEGRDQIAEAIEATPTPAAPKAAPEEVRQRLATDDEAAAAHKLASVGLLDPVRPTRTENSESVAKAVAVMKPVNEDWMTNLKAAEDEILKVDGNVVSDVTPRTNLKQAELAKNTFALIARHGATGNSKDIGKLVRFARANRSRDGNLIVEVAFFHATKAAKVRVEKAHAAITANNLKTASTADQMAMEVELDMAMKAYFGLRSIDQDLGSHAGRSLQARKSKVDMADVKADNKAPKPNKKTLEYLDDVAERKVGTGGGFVDDAAEFKRLRELGVKPSDVQTLQSLRKLEESHVTPARKMKDKGPEPAWKTVLSYIETFRFGAMLSGPATQATNIASMAVQSARFTAAELMSPSTSRFGLDRTVGMITNLPQSASYGFQSMWHFKRILADVDKLGFPDPKKIPVIDSMLRLMTGSDEFFRQNWYRGEIYAKAMQEGRLAGLKGTQLTSHARKRVNESLKDGHALNRVAEQNASALAFQRRFNRNSDYYGERQMGRIQDFAEQNFLTRLAFPFTRVAMDLMDTSIRNMPVVNFALGKTLRASGQNSRFLDDFEGLNGTINQSKAKADIATGSLVSLGVASLVMEGKITGSASPNYLEAGLEEQAGLPPPMSIQLPNGEWVSYERWEPFATLMKTIVNATEYNQDYQWRVQNGLAEDTGPAQAQEFAMAMAFLMGQAISTQTYAESTESLLAILTAMGTGDKLGDKVWRYGVQTGESFIPNALKKLNEQRNEHTYTAREVHGLLRHISSFIPDFEHDIARSIYTGEAKVATYDQEMKRLNPWGSAAVEPNPGVALLMEANKFTGSNFKIKSPTAFAGSGHFQMDLRKLPSSKKGRSLYDQWSEAFATVTAKGGNIHGLPVAGLTYTEALAALSKFPAFNKLAWINEGVDLSKTTKSNSKKKWIDDIKKAYQNAATTHLLKTDSKFKKLSDEVGLNDGLNKLMDVEAHQ